MMRSKRPYRFSRKSCIQSLKSARELRWARVTVKPVRSGFAGVAVQAVVEPGRDIEPLRGRNSAFEPREGERQAPCRVHRDIEWLFESLLSEAFNA